MDYRVTWSPEALDDVAHNLGTFPNAGRAVPELGDDTICERFVYSYRLIYRVRDDTVLVAAVVHGKRMLEPLEGRITESK